MLLDKLRRNWKHLIAKNRADLLMQRLRDEVLKENAPIYNDLIQIQARHEANRRGQALGVISFEHTSLTFNSVNEALLWLIDRIEREDLNSYLRKQNKEFISIPSYHAFSVDRNDQVEKFDNDRVIRSLREDPDCRVYFYFLYGDLRQETKSLTKRMSFLLGGHTFTEDFLRDVGPIREPLFLRCKPEPRGNKEVFQIFLLKSLIEKFIGPVNNLRGLRDKTLLDLLPSPKLAGLGKNDKVCVLVSLDDYNWNKEVVPAVLRELYQTFCACELPPEAPAFYFFFGVEYAKDNERVKQEVAAAIEQSKYGEALPELQPVPLKDIAYWFRHHESLIPPGREAADRATELFPDAERLDMDDIEIKLEELIDRHNEGLVTGK